MNDLNAEHATNSGPLAPDLLHKINNYWNAANYLSVGQIYLYANPLLKQPLQTEHIKPRLLGHWGTTPGLNFIYVHLNRVIKQSDLNMIFIAGPGHGGPALVANTYLEGTYSEIYPDIPQNESGLQRFFKQFSFPGGIPSHVAPETPGSIHEGGELGYALSHAYGAAFDNPDLIVACVIGDGEAETGPLATSWHSNKFLNPARDGAVLPILHLNGFKIASPTILARIPHAELEALFIGYGYAPHFVEGDDPLVMHQQMAATLDTVIAKIKHIQDNARNNKDMQRPLWPMIILRSPKGWTCPQGIDGKKTEGSFRAHQVPLDDMKNADHIAVLEQWMQSYKPQELFDESGKLHQELAELAPQANRRMGANPYANGGLLLQDLHLPNTREYAVKISQPGSVDAESTKIMGEFLRDVLKKNSQNKNFRLFSPDENNSNRWQDALDATGRTWLAEHCDDDEKLDINGRIMEVLSEHQCQGWLEGYLLTGRHGFYSCYEAFIHIVDSMVNQHAKWLKTANHISWRKPVASLNYLLSSHVWRQDHNGSNHQDPGFIDHVVNKKAEVVRVYLPPDANTLLWITEHCLKSYNKINVVVSGKHKEPQWLDIDAAAQHCAAGIGVWEWASNCANAAPDVVIASAGDVATLEALAAVQLLWTHFPELKIRFVNVIDLMKLQSAGEHPHGLSNNDFDQLFTKDKPIIFAYHGYPTLIHKLTYKRTNIKNLHVHGFKEEGTTTTPFDMTVLNQLDRFHIMKNVVERVSKLSKRKPWVADFVNRKLAQHKRYIEEHGEDLAEIQQWKWTGEKP
ncbi:MAG: phosphoketolase family protein [Cellvibrio sp.]|uniref:phosphoketolase family protein n=1 Tax=Cellvibrio sp. TaxID=1965322 RepID=UPI0031A67182